MGQHVHGREISVREHRRAPREQGRNAIKEASQRGPFGPGQPGDLAGPADRTSGEPAGISPQAVELDPLDRQLSEDGQELAH